MAGFNSEELVGYDTNIGRI